MLATRGLRKTFAPAQRGQRGTVAVAGVDLDIQEGTFTSILGPSGSGKTTLLRCIAGFERPESGTITLRGREIASPTHWVAPYARRIGVVPQEGALFPHLSVAQNIAFGLTGTTRRERRAQVASLLELVGLSDLGARYPFQLSGGQQQRVALARALAPKPSLILLDEPFSALDARLRSELREEVRDLLNRVGATTILVTHDQSEAMSLADQLIVMRHGQVAASGPPAEIYRYPPDIEVARFLGEALILPGQAFRQDGQALVRCAFGELMVDRWHGAEGACDVLIRPEQFQMASVHLETGSSRPAGVVTAFSFFGHDAVIRIQIPGISQQVTVRLAGRADLRVGDHARVAVNGTVCTYRSGAASYSPLDQ